MDENGYSLATYHYHAQIFDAVVGANSKASAGEKYLVSTPGKRVNKPNMKSGVGVKG